MKFSLKKLLINAAVLCVVLGVALAFPVAMASVTVKLLLVAPTLGVAALASWLSRNRRLTLIVVAAGAFAGWILAPRVLTTWGRPPTFWDHFLIDFDTVGVYAAAGAFVFALIEFGVSAASRRTTYLPMDRPQKRPASLDKYARAAFLMFVSGIICGIVGLIFPQAALVRNVLLGVAFAGGITFLGVGYSIARMQWNYSTWTLVLPLLPIVLLGLIYVFTSGKDPNDLLGTIIGTVWYVNLFLVFLLFLVSCAGWIGWWRNERSGSASR